jgi:sulfur carrier protein ThiS adenylyltransferase
MIPTDRFARQHDLVPSDRLAEADVLVVGVGAIGRQVALQSAALGVRRLTLIDIDRVEPTNITTQGYGHADLGRLKVEALQEAIVRLDPTVEGFGPKQRPGNGPFASASSSP